MVEASKAGTGHGRLIAGLGAAAFLLYLCTLAPGLLWGDSARFADRSIGYLPGAEPGEHHLRNLVGRLANDLPIRTVPWRQNLVSAIFGALAVAQLASVVLFLGGSARGATVAAAALAVSHTHWHLSVICESYTLLELLLLVAMELLLRWQATGRAACVVGAAFVLGLAASDHLMTLVLGPAVVLFLVVGRPWPGARAAARALPWIPLLAVVFATGYLPALSGAVRVHLETGRMWSTVFYDLLDLRGQKYLGGTGALHVLTSYGKLALFTGYQFPLVAGILGVVGAVSSLRSGARRALLPLFLFLATFTWCGLYLQQRNVYLMIVAYAAFAVWVGRGAEVVLAKWGTKALAVLLALSLAAPPLLYAATPTLVRRFHIPVGGAYAVRDMGVRDELRYFLVPWKNGEDSAERYGRQALTLAPPGSTIVHDFTPGAVLSYLQSREGIGREVRLMSIEHALGRNDDLGPFVEAKGVRGDVFLADDAEVYRVDRLRARFDVTPVGPLLRVRKR